MSTEYRLLVPLDVLYLRGNRLFGGPGDHAEPLMPPWPSLFAGALRSRMLADEGIDFALFAKGEIRHPALGTPAAPGPFRVAHVSLGRLRDEPSGKKIEPLVRLPADVVVMGESGKEGRYYLQPAEREKLKPLRLSGELPAVALLRAEGPAKPGQDGYWLGRSGMEKYLCGAPLEAGDLVPRQKLWEIDSRLGIALDGATRAAETGRIYTTEAVAMCRGTGFLVGVAGAQLPQGGLIRLGGDGRGAELLPASFDEPWLRIPKTRGFRLVLSTPGLFPGGWLPPGVGREQDDWYFQFRGLRARLRAASIPRHQVISGWDLAAWKPKPAQRAAPAGTVYWFEIVERDSSALEELLKEGLWPLMEAADRDRYAQRRAEGFNNVWLGDWEPR